MADILSAATSATKFFLEVNQISIDNWTFKLFYKATTTLLLACSVVASSKQFFGDPISCEVSGGGVNDGVLSSYCWMYATFNIPLNFRGVCSKREIDGATLYNSYYQWVSIFLVVSAMFFYLPRAIWLMAEGGLMKFLAKGTTTKIIEDAEEKRENLINTFQEHLHNKYNRYAMGFFCCEQFNFVVVLTSWFVTNKFLKYKFLTYGPQVIAYYNIPPEERLLVNQNPNPMCESFPRIAACTYHRFGSGGGPETKQAICVLGLNMINDKIFLVLWFWYFALTLFGVLRLFYRVCQLSSRRFRCYILRFRINRYFKTDANMRHVEHYARNCAIGDWFVLYQMSRNMNTRFFAEFLTVLSRRVNPCPGLDEVLSDCTLLLPEKASNSLRGRLAKNNSTLSLHDRILDVTYVPGGSGEEEVSNKKKDAEVEVSKKETDEEPKQEDNEQKRGRSKKFKFIDDDDEDEEDELNGDKSKYGKNHKNHLRKK